MSDRLLSVGLDVGTTTTQLIVSALTVENQASGFTVPEMVIADREILYRGKVHFTPLLHDELVDAEKLRLIVEEEYEKAGIRRRQVDTGAVIITGETSRKENAGAVLRALSDLAGEFVVATAGPDLESLLAAKGAGAAAWSEKTGKRVLHMDIGGGTSNLALIQDGKVVQTGCLNVGGRLLKVDENGRITYKSPVLQNISSLQVGDKPTGEQLEDLARQLASALEMAAGLTPANELLDELTTRQNKGPWKVPEGPLTVSFSGGVADCIEKNHEPFAFGDMGPVLGRAIRKSKLCQGEFMLGKETIRATVIGAGCHSTRLSGSTVFHKNVSLPQKDLPVAVFTEQEQESLGLPTLIRERAALSDKEEVVLSMPGWDGATYEQVKTLAGAILEGVGERPVYVCLQSDMAKALGQRLSLELSDGRPCLCIDRVKLSPESFLDVGAPVGPCLPVVIKTLVMESQTN